VGTASDVRHDAVISRDAVCLDIGANIGIFTLVMSSLAAEGHVFAIEPSSRNLMFLRENLRLNDIANVTVLQNALWDRSCDLELFYLDELAGCSFLQTSRIHQAAMRKIRAVVTQPWLDTTTLHDYSETVPCTRLDDLAVSIGLNRLDFIKLDAEGAEMAVLSGAQDTLMRYRPRLITEFNPACMIQYFEQDPSEYYDC
jgi:FkbM family methyltransferase